MNYKQQIEQAERKSKNAQTANNILTLMDKMRLEADKNTSRRWIWELIQNAKDVAIDEQQVSIEIAINNKDNTNSVSFSHNGKPFNIENIVFLINQVSTKDRTPNQNGEKPKTTGKFGTGFLTTHLLSEKVKVIGIVKEKDLDYKRFTLPLDRSGRNPEDILESVKKSVEILDTFDEQHSLNNFNPQNLNTTFFYKLNEEGYEVAKVGIEDLHLSIPYTLAFLPSIKSVSIKHEDVVYERSKIESLTGFIKVSTILKKTSLEKSEFKIITLEKNNTTIAVEVEHISNKIHLKCLSNELPKIFCDFPLIGTNDFTLPFVINNPDFNPTEPRDGVWLTDHNTEPKILENKEIFLDSVNLYFELLDFAIENRWENLFLLANTETPLEKKWFSRYWFEENIQKPIRSKLTRLPIVTLENGERTSILNEEGKANIYFPYHSKNVVRERIWELEYKLFPNKIPAIRDIHNWYIVIWNNCYKDNLKAITEYIAEKKSIDEISKLFNNDSTKSIGWLNEYFDLLNFEGQFIDEIIYDKFAVIPNQKGIFKKRSELEIDLNIEEELKNVLDILGVNIRDRLRHQGINTVSKYKEENKGQILYTTKTQDSTINEINLILKGNNNPNSGTAISLLLSLYSDDEAFPVYRKQLYDFCKDLITEEIPERKLIKKWSENIWECTDNPRTGRLMKIISECKSLSGLTKRLKKANEDETIAWLNSFIDFLITRGYSDKLNFKDSPILPNQKGNFLIKDELYIDDRSIDEELKVILELLGQPIREELLDKRILLDSPKNRERDIQFVADKITSLIQKRFSEITRSNETKVIFKSLCLWFNKNKNWLDENQKKEEDSFFKSLYANKHKLYDDDEIAENIHKAEQLDSIMKEFNLGNAEELKTRLNQGNNTLVSFFGDRSNNGEAESIYEKALGFIIDKLKEANINSVADFLLLIDNLKVGNILIRTNPNPINQTTIGPKTPEEKKEYAIQFTSEAIGATIRHLQKLGYEILFEKYNIDYPTVFKVKYKESTFDLVIRPCHFSKYKIYSHEKEILKNDHTELWLSDGNLVMKETLFQLMFRIIDSGANYIPTEPFLPGRLIV